MKIKKYFPVLFFITIAASLLLSCNLSVAMASPTQQVTATNTAMPVFSPSPTQTFTPTATITPLPTLVPLSLVIPTVTPAQQWVTCPGVIVSQSHTDKGEMLHIFRCEDELEYDLGPLAKGVFAVGPNNKFLVYIASSGIVYATRIGDLHFFVLYNLVKEHIFTVFNKGVAPDFDVSFSGGTPIYRLILLEKNYDQKRMYILPTRLTQ
jgi:hypothetical protein